MKIRLKQFLSVSLILLISISLASCNFKSVLTKDDDREEESREDIENEKEDETEHETKDKEDVSIDVTVPLVPSSEEPSAPPVVQTVETSEEDLEASVESMLPVLDAIAYVMTFESETGIYDSGDTNFTAKVLYMGTQLHGPGIFNDTEDVEGMRTVSYADIEEFANACFDTLTVDITIGDEYGRLTYNETENVFYAGLGDGMYESEIENITLSDDGTIRVLFNVIEPDSDTLLAQYTFTLVDNDFIPASGLSRYPYSVSSVEGVE